MSDDLKRAIARYATGLDEMARSLEALVPELTTPDDGLVRLVTDHEAEGRGSATRMADTPRRRAGLVFGLVAAAAVIVLAFPVIWLVGSRSSGETVGDSRTTAVSGIGLVGAWEAIDADGSHITAEIAESGEIHMADDSNLRCGTSWTFSGVGTFEGDKLIVTGESVCRPPGEPASSAITTTWEFVYSAESDTITTPIDGVEYSRVGD